MNRKRLIIGAAIFIVLVFLVSAGFGIRWWRKNHQPQAHQRLIVTNLAYCNSNDIKPCVESFSVDADDNMLVNLLMPDSSYPDFYLTISNDTTVNKYECQKVKDFPTNIYCTGEEMYPGEALQFTLVSIEDDTVLAKGKFAIIGLLLPNPSEEVTETPAATETSLATETMELTESPTPILLEILTPIPTRPFSVTPTPTKATPSYPNYP